MKNGHPTGESPFHLGEQQVQDRLGVRDIIEPFARRVVRDHMPEEHQNFYAGLSFVLIGSVNGLARPWASILAGPPGFIASPNPKKLTIAAMPPESDPLHRTLRPGAEIGLLGIDLQARRRNRLTGRVSTVSSEGFTIDIRQTFGNCPQYIQARETHFRESGSSNPRTPSIRSDRFDKRSRAIITSADTLFVATAYLGEPGQPSHGADVSHRGGKPGFVRFEDDRTFVFPDFSGNNHFNTVGNILMNPRAGFLFAEFDSGDLIYTTGTSEIVWEGDDVRAFTGAERLIRFRAEEVIRVENSLPLRFDFQDYSPMLDLTGSWAETAERITVERERNLYIPFEVLDIQRESDLVTSFYLRRADGKALASHEPGQFLPIRLTVPGCDTPVRRTYTISDAPDRGYYRLSVKREGGNALVSNFLHDNAAHGVRLEAMAPRGTFALDQSSERPVVLISAGVGVTPMIAMINFIVNEGRRTRFFRRTHFIHGVRDGHALAFGTHIRTLAKEHDAISAHIRFSQPGADDRLGETHDSEGRIDIDLLKKLLPFDDHDFYLCGPPPFMQDLYEGLVGLGVRDSRIHYEAFGPATILKRDAHSNATMTADGLAGGPVAVRFAKTDREAVWTPDKGTLLDFAESAGLSPEFSCRSGICGTCATRIRCGDVDYIKEPVADRADGSVLICCASPRPGSGSERCGDDIGVVLDL